MNFFCWQPWWRFLYKFHCGQLHPVCFNYVCLYSDKCFLKMFRPCFFMFFVSHVQSWIIAYCFCTILFIHVWHIQSFNYMLHNKWVYLRTFVIYKFKRLFLAEYTIGFLLFSNTKTGAFCMKNQHKHKGFNPLWMNVMDQKCTKNKNCTKIKLLGYDRNINFSIKFKFCKLIAFTFNFFL